MPDLASLPAATPLTTLSEDETLFRDNVRQFAEEKVRPLAREMDEKSVFDQGLLEQFFQLGLMGIEVPEELGGAGGKFFDAILAVEELSRADASAGVVVDVQNTLVVNALLRWGNAEQKKGYLSRMAADAMLLPEGLRMAVNYGLDRVRFLAPVRAGKRVRGRFVLDSVEEKAPGQILLRHTVTVEIEGEEKPALTAQWLGLMFVQGD